MTSVACVGCGFVGGSLTTVLSERGIDVYVYDKAGVIADRGLIIHAWPARRAIESVSELVVGCEDDNRGVPSFSGIYFVCLPTPMKKDGSCDTSIVESVLVQLASVPRPLRAKGPRIAVVKSTVPPGSTERWNKMFEQQGRDLRVVFSPEFLKEASALDDMRNQDRIILGGPKSAVNVVKNMLQSAFPTVPIHKTSSANAELVKYMANCFLAVKVSFANEFYQVCDALSKDVSDVDYDRVVELATLDKRLGDSHWKVPSFEVDESGKPLYGYSLSCFPKDTNALIAIADRLGIDLKVTRGAVEKNLEVRPGRDWEQLKGRAVVEEKDEK